MIRARLAGVYSEWRRCRASRIASGRAAWWWLSLRRPQVAHPASWLGDRLLDARAIGTIIFVCGWTGHRFEITPSLFHEGQVIIKGFTACRRCATHLEDLA